MENLEKLLESMTLEFFGNKQHKITSATFLLQENSLFLDVRAQEEFETIAFTLLPYMPVLHIPINEIPKKLEEIPRNKNIGIFCSSGFRSTIVYLYLKTKGFENIRIIEGGYAELAAELKPGKLIKQLSKNKKK